MRLCKKITVACFLILLAMPNSFAQSFSDSLNWTVKCINLRNHSERSYSGTPNDLPSFQKLFKEKTVGFENEDLVYIKLKFNGTDAILEDTLPYSQAKHFWTNHSLLLSDCEEYNYSSYSGRGGRRGLWVEPMFNKSFNNIESEIDRKLKAPQGSGSFYLEYGGEANEDTRKIYPSLTRNQLQTENIFYKNKNPKDLYFFLYLYGTGNANAIFSLNVTEFNMYDFHDNKFDFYSYTIPLSFKGWKQFAIRYSDMKIDMKRSTSNLTREPDKINSISYGLINGLTKEKARLNIDYLMLLH
ncbi:MAG TPA: hypothetical protein VNW06_00060 [Cytophagaceae bacterium]|jgi:hypothetical protein|nr:hypothetical protein [Cytophagaceae bacterium]